MELICGGIEGVLKSLSHLQISLILKQNKNNKTPLSAEGPFKCLFIKCIMNSILTQGFPQISCNLTAIL